jgi:hypothetical protein
LLALWAYPPEIVPLSYRLHRELAEEHDGANLWGYRQLQECGTIYATVTEDDLAAQKNLREAREEASLTLRKATDESRRKSLSRSNSGESTVATKRNYEEEENDEPQPPVADVPAPLPIQSTLADETAETLQARQEDATKVVGINGMEEWETLPKQDAAAASQLRESRLPEGLDWIESRLVDHYEVMGPPRSTDTAQVHPYHFTTNMARLAKEKGVDVRIGCMVTGLDFSADGVRGVEYLERACNVTRTIEGVTDIVITAGPWTGVLLPKSRIEALRAHSVVWEADVSPFAVFTEIGLPESYIPEHRAKRGEKRKHAGKVDPEIYARPFNEVYACGSPLHLPC